MQGGAVARRYAKALIDLAARDDRVAEIGEQLRQHRQLLNANADLQKVLDNPSVSAEVKARVLTGILERTQPPPLLCSFILLLVDKDRLRQFDLICAQEYRKYKATFHANPPSGASQHPARTTSATGTPPQPPPERQLSSLAGSQQVTGWRRQ